MRQALGALAVIQLLLGFILIVAAYDPIVMATYIFLNSLLVLALASCAFTDKEEIEKLQKQLEKEVTL